jgi:DNA repair protein RecO (recombination protein O)
MLHKTKGLVLNTINYNDKYILVHIFTEDFGRVTYMVTKTKSRNTKVPRAFFTPLALLDLEVDHQSSREIQRIREAQSMLQLHSISSDMKKTSMVFFLSEFLSKVLKDINESKLLFDFLYQSVYILEMTDKSIANFHLVFMLKLSKFLGFYPNLEEYSEGQYFDMMNGEFVFAQPFRHYINKQESFALARLRRITYENMYKFGFSQQERINIINRMLEYYRLHLYDFPQLKSLEVLHELF